MKAGCRTLLINIFRFLMKNYNRKHVKKSRSSEFPYGSNLLYKNGEANRLKRVILWGSTYSLFDWQLGQFQNWPHSLFDYDIYIIWKYLIYCKKITFVYMGEGLNWTMPFRNSTLLDWNFSKQLMVSDYSKLFSHYQIVRLFSSRQASYFYIDFM